MSLMIWKTYNAKVDCVEDTVREELTIKARTIEEAYGKIQRKLIYKKGYAEIDIIEIEEVNG